MQGWFETSSTQPSQVKRLELVDQDGMGVIFVHEDVTTGNTRNSCAKTNFLWL